LPKAKGRSLFRGKKKAKRQPTTGGREPEPEEQRLLAWRMARVDLDEEWGWRKLDAADLEQLHRLLTEYETTPLHKLRHDERIREIPVEDICPEAQERLARLEQEDIEALHELRLGHHNWRAWGILDRSTFYFLWWDPEHTVCTGRDRARSRSR